MRDRTRIGNGFRRDLAPVLVVTPEEGTRAALLGWLRGAGYSAVGLSSFADARDALQRAIPDVLIAEVRLGAFNGLHLVHAAGADGRLPRAILLTRHEDPVVAAEAARVGAACLSLPLSREVFLECVARALSSAPPG